MDGYLDMREGALYIVRGRVLTPLPDPVEIEADTLVDYNTVRTLDAEAVEGLRQAALRYVENARRYKAGLRRIDD